MQFEKTSLLPGCVLLNPKLNLVYIFTEKLAMLTVIRQSLCLTALQARLTLCGTKYYEYYQPEKSEKVLSCLPVLALFHW